jgi:hypothetical protein
MQKYEIVNALIAGNSYRRYLEICTPTTGHRFSRIHRAGLRWRHRLMYCCPPSFEDGSEITFRSADDQISHLLDPSLLYDIVFIDPYHSFACSLRDLRLALDILHPKGAIVVHDCNPPNRELSDPSFRSGSWFGLTYCAYIELLLSRPELVYYTVDTDCGCGVIKKLPSEKSGTTNSRGNNELVRRWHLERDQQGDMFEFFDQHRQELLNLIPVRDFLAREKVALPRFSRLTQWRESVAARLQI